MSIVTIPPGSQAYVTARYDAVNDRFHVTESVSPYDELPPSGDKVIRIPALSKGYLWTVYDAIRDLFDVKKLVIMPSEFGLLWAWWRFEEDVDSGGSDVSRVDSSGNGHDFEVLRTWPVANSKNVGSYGGGHGDEHVTAVKGGLYRGPLGGPYDELVPGSYFETSYPNDLSFDLDVTSEVNSNWLNHPDVSTERYKKRIWIYYSLTDEYHNQGWEEVTWESDQGFATVTGDYPKISYGGLPHNWRRLYPFAGDFVDLLGFNIVGSVIWNGTYYLDILVELIATTGVANEPTNVYPSSDVGVCGQDLTIEVDGQGVWLNPNTFPMNGNGDTQFSYVAWIKPGGDGIRIVGECSIIFSLESSGKYSLLVTIGNLSVLTADIYDADTWYFVVAYFDGTGLYVEVDNSLVGSDLADNHGETGQSYLYVTGLSATEGSYSELDEFRIYLGALTADQRNELWNSGSGKCTE